AQVAALGEQEPARPGDAVHRGDGRLRYVDVATELGYEVRRRHGQRDLGHFLQVALGAERLVPGAGEHQHPGAVVGVEAPDPGVQALPGRRVERVAGLRALDGEPGDAVVDPVADRVGHRTSPCFIAGQAGTEPDVEIHGDDIWEILFTSGTTALPKGVMISHACSYAAGFGFALSLTRGLRLACGLKVGTYLPMIYHVGDQPFTYSVFLCGGTLVLGRRPNPGHIAEMIDAEGVTALWAGSPAMVRALDAVLTARPDLDARSLTVIVYGWAALPP